MRAGKEIYPVGMFPTTARSKLSLKCPKYEMTVATIICIDNVWTSQQASKRNECPATAQNTAFMRTSRQCKIIVSLIVHSPEDEQSLLLKTSRQHLLVRAYTPQKKCSHGCTHQITKGIKGQRRVLQHTFKAGRVEPRGGPLSHGNLRF